MLYNNKVDYIAEYQFQILAVLLIILFILLVLLMLQPQPRKRIQKASLDKAHGIIFGRLGRKVVYSPTDDEGSVGVFSATGTGKTTAIGIPTLRSWNGTSFTIDISGDICKNCPKIPNKLIFEPENPNTSPYNIFGAIDDLSDQKDRDEALEQLAFLLMPESPNLNDNALYFLNNGRKILTAALIAFYSEGMDFIPICRRIVGSSYRDLFNEIDSTHNENAILYINSFVGVSEQNVSGCKQACDDAIKLFATNGKIRNSVRRPQKNEEFIQSKFIEDHNIFVIVDDPKLTLYSPLLNILTSQQMQYISNRKVNNKSKSILLFLDEYASLHIDANTILEALRKYRKRKCRLMIMTQNLADLDLLYGASTTRALLSNMYFKVLLGGLQEVESQEYFAKLIGFQKTKKKSTSTSATHTTRTITEEKEYIIEPADLDRQGDDVAILIFPKEGHLKLQKNYYYTQKRKKVKRMFNLFRKKTDTINSHPDTKVVATDYLKVIYPSEIVEMEIPSFNQSDWSAELEYKESLERIQPLIEEYERTGSIHDLTYSSISDIDKNADEQRTINNFKFFFMDKRNWINVEKTLSGQYRVLDNGQHRMYIARKYDLKLLVHVSQEVKN